MIMKRNRLKKWAIVHFFLFVVGMILIGLLFSKILHPDLFL